MEKQNNQNIEKTNIELPEYTKELKEKAMEIINPSKMKKLVSDLNVDNVTGDLFYESVKLFFDIGFGLADKLNLELLEDFLKKEKLKD